MALYAIPNLSTSTVSPVKPWEVVTYPPESALANKTAYMTWSKKSSSEGCYFSGFEGADPGMRVSRDNMPRRLHALVADFDSEISEALEDELLKGLPTQYEPNWISTTFSGGRRLVWLFEEPVPMQDPALISNFLKIAGQRLQLRDTFPGWDDGAFTNASQYYDIGFNWRQVSAERIPRNIVYQWAYEAGNKVKWDKKYTAIPIDMVAREIERRFPKKWPGDFDVGARGPRFWDPMATNPTAAVVRPEGIQCFSGDQSFISWKELLGAGFVQEYEAERTGEVISDIYYDGKGYWKKTLDGIWAPNKPEDMRLALRVKYGLNHRSKNGENCSEVDRVLFAIQEQKRVKAVLPFIHQPEGVIFKHGEKYLNSSKVSCIKPANDGGIEWGDGFPWLAEFLDNFFDPKEQLDYFLAWWKHFYENGLIFKPRAGQAVFIAGSTGVGKTLLTNEIVARTVGGCADASDFLLGTSNFTSHVLSFPLMTVDDTSPASDRNRHNRYSSMLKKIIANRNQTFEEKFLPAGQVDWLGRVTVTCNLDPESIKIMPNLELSTLDKICLFKAALVQKTFPSEYEIQSTLDKELPYFCNWLLQWRIPEHCKGTSRFGVACYHHKELFDTSIQGGASYSFFELLDQFLKVCSTDEDKESHWEGTTTELMSEMLSIEGIKELARQYTTTQAGSLLGQLKARGFGLTSKRVGTSRVWNIPYALDYSRGE